MAISKISSSTLRELNTDDSLTEATAGNIAISTGSLFVRQGAEIDASTSDIGDAGNITINATDTISVSGSGVLIPSNGEEVEIFFQYF